jgi:urease beta subunit
LRAMTKAKRAVVALVGERKVYGFRQDTMGKL